MARCYFQKYYAQYDNKTRSIHCWCCNPYGDTSRAAKPFIRKLARRKARQQLHKAVFIEGTDEF